MINKGGIERLVVSVILVALVIGIVWKVIDISKGGTNLVGSTVNTVPTMQGASMTVEKK